MNDICKHCKYKRFTCAAFRCDPYKEAKRKQAERRFYQMFPIEDYDGEDRYVAGEIILYVIIALIVIFNICCTIKVIGDWRTL